MLASQDNVQLFKLLCQPHHIIIMWKHKYWALEGGRVSREHQRRGKADLLPAQPCSRSCPVFPSCGFALEMLLEVPTSHTAQPHHVLHWVFHPTNATRSLILLVSPPILTPPHSHSPLPSPPLVPHRYLVDHISRQTRRGCAGWEKKWCSCSDPELPEWATARGWRAWELAIRIPELQSKSSLALPKA